MKKIFIDTNIYLNFYRMSDQTLFLLDTLITQIEKGEIELIIPEQVKHEFYRWRSRVINESVLELKKLLYPNMKTPVILKSYKGVKDAENIRKKLSNKYNEIIEEFQKRALNPQSGINKKLDKLFALARNILDNDQIIQRAHTRHLRGDPPFKGNHDFGDCISWETLLENVSASDLFIVSNDGDYEFDNPSKKGEINNFLKMEWKNKEGKNVSLSKSFAEFLKPYVDKEQVKAEEIEEAITEEKEVSRFSTISARASIASFGTDACRTYSTLGTSGTPLTAPDNGYSSAGLRFDSNIMTDVSQLNTSEVGKTNDPIELCKGCGLLSSTLDQNGYCTSCRNDGSGLVTRL